MTSQKNNSRHWLNRSNTKRATMELPTQTSVLLIDNNASFIFSVDNIKSDSGLSQPSVVEVIFY